MHEASENKNTKAFPLFSFGKHAMKWEIQYLPSHWPTQPATLRAATQRSELLRICCQKCRKPWQCRATFCLFVLCPLQWQLLRQISKSFTPLLTQVFLSLAPLPRIASASCSFWPPKQCIGLPPPPKEIISNSDGKWKLCWDVIAKSPPPPHTQKFLVALPMSTSIYLAYTLSKTSCHSYSFLKIPTKLEKKVC